MVNILVIDDVEAAGDLLMGNGYNVITAENGSEGLRKIKESTPDVVVMDILLPNMEGLETIRQIVKINPELPIIAIASPIDSSYLEIARQLGFVHGIYRPTTRIELLTAIENIIKTDSVFHTH